MAEPKSMALLSRLFRRPAKLRTHLVALVALAILPVVIFAGVMIVAFGRQQQRFLENGLLDTARALSLAVDRELTAWSNILETLASSEHLDSGDLRKFYSQAQRVLETRQDWDTIVLVELPRRQVLNLRRPFGVSLPDVQNSAQLTSVVETRKPVVSDLFSGQVLGKPLVGIAVPVIRAGKVRYVLMSAVSPASLSRLLLQQKLSDEWEAGVIDRNKIIIARTRNIEQLIGKPAGQRFATKSKESQETAWRGTMRDGQEVYSALHRSGLSGWTVGIALPVTAIDTPIRSHLVTVIGGGFVLLLIGIGIAAVFGRRISSSIATLTQSAAALGHSETAKIVASPIVEVNEVARAIEDAAISRHRATEEIQQNLTRIQALHEIDIAISSTLEIRDALNILLEKIDLFLPYFTVSTIRLLKKATGDLEPIACRGVDEKEWKERTLDAWSGAAHRAFETKSPVFSRNAPEDPQTKDPDFARKQGWISRLVVPLITKEESLGVLAIYTKEEREFSKTEIDSMVALAERAAIAIHNAQLFKDTQTEHNRSRLLARLLLTAQEKERERISHELHDEIGQHLTAIKLTLESLEAGTPGETKQRFNELYGLVVDAMVKIRSMILDIRPPMLEHLGLLHTLQSHFDRYTAQTQVEVEFRHNGLEKRLGMGIEVAAYRIVQEALTNVARYAGVKKATVRAENKNKTLIVEISDQGKGFDALAKVKSGKTMGLSGMRERAASLGGRFEARSSPESGTQIRVEIPLEPS